MIRLVCFLSLLTLAACAARADQYWIAYEGNDFPENQGWRRRTLGGGAVRFIDQGSLVIDSRASLEIIDSYSRDLNGDLDPDPGELFVAQWRLRIDEVVGRVDPALGVFSDENWAAAFQLNEDTIFSTFERGVSARFDPGVFHDFELQSRDMRAYDLYIDGDLAISGSFWLSLTPSRVFWGDSIQGGASLTHWDYFRFGVVPEPGPGLLFAFWLASWRASR